MMASWTQEEAFSARDKTQRLVMAGWDAWREKMAAWEEGEPFPVVPRKDHGDAASGDLCWLKHNRYIGAIPHELWWGKIRRQMVWPTRKISYR